nr:Uncharacterised protein [Citrobacter werkmanii]
MAVAISRVTPAVIHRLQIPVQVLLYAGLFVLLNILSHGCICRFLPTWLGWC